MARHLHAFLLLRPQVAPSARAVTFRAPPDDDLIMAPPSPGESGKAAWSAQILVAHGIRALREAQSVVLQLSNDVEPKTTDQVHALLAIAVEHASSAYHALIPVAEE